MQLGLVGLPEDASRDVTTAADGDHEVGFEVIEDTFGRCPTQLVYLVEIMSALLVKLCDAQMVEG